ncbi:hypothetical protein DL96DRAFT_1459096 [Flagelloscypha sp. PMI_526]|nr:hypothetical protein DL96DRAFT_1459096 [Flagelloscypha sp. PMI_526]
MFTCNICLEELKDPASIPCGHVYCTPCLIRTVNATHPYSELTHHCPTCRAAFIFSAPDPAIVPLHLQPYITPSVRRLYLETSPIVNEDDETELGPSSWSSSSSSASSSSSPPTQINRLSAENATLRTHLEKWRIRAEIHGNANLSFLHLTKTAKYAAIKCQREKEDIQRKYEALVRKVEMMSTTTPSDHPLGYGYVFLFPKKWAAEADAELIIKIVNATRERRDTSLVLVVGLSDHLYSRTSSLHLLQRNGEEIIKFDCLRFNIGKRRFPFRIPLQAICSHLGYIFRNIYILWHLYLCFIRNCYPLLSTALDLYY